ncbi:threonine/serine exporter ThrE family protein [Rothia sp. ZJ932]|uniref:threonine/serine ThrE exporter family protein n=1 Tax=Rothia sp. ZJ932 TaxID=2810516 RepID=UPI001966EB8A|nr:threonine/serine exporter family protein [Rothia sp. ZJ932]QRZ61899.1 threonine/serine exporter family protein [Rothia sp. ZJ932]
MASTDKTQLQQKAYPSAFEQVSLSLSSEGAFGSSAGLPRARDVAAKSAAVVDSNSEYVAHSSGTSVAEGSAKIHGAENLGETAGGAAELPSASLDAFGSSLPAIDLSRVKDPGLRDYLLNHKPDSTGENTPDAFGAAHDMPVAATTEDISPFGPAATQQSEPTPLTTAIPLATTTLLVSGTGMQQASYPSVAPATAGIPQVKSAPKSPSKVRSTLKSFVQPDKSLTKPVRGLERISQRQFAMSSRKHRERYVREKEEAREVLNFTLRLSETMFHYGADAMDVDSAIVAVCAAYGLDEVEVDITNQSVIINYVSDIDGLVDSNGHARGDSFERFSHTVVRVVRSWSENYAALADVYKLIHDITEKGLSREDADRKLNRINNAKKLYSPMTVMIANIAAAGTLTIGIGGSWRAGLVSSLLFLCVYFMDQMLSKLNMPSFFHMAASAGLITFAAIYLGDSDSFLTQLGIPVSAPHIVAAGLIMLLPTFKLVSAVQDAINGFPLTAAGRFVSTAMSFLGLVVGLASGVAALSFMGATPLDISQSKFDTPEMVTNIVFMTLASLSIAVTTQTRKRTLGWIVLVTVTSMLIYHGFTAVFGAGSGRGNTAIAALVIGLLSTLLAHRFHAPQAIFSIPSLTFLLPGLSIFRGLYSFTVEADSVMGVPGMVTALAIILSMASGVVLGGYIMQYLIQRFAPQQSATTDNLTQAIPQVMDR